VSSVTFLSITDQVAEHLRSEILRGRWNGTLPGKHQLADELGVNNKTVEAALRQLEKTGLLLPQGAGRNRLINLRRRTSSRALRIALLLNELPHDAKSELHLEIAHALTGAGHAAVVAPKSLDALRFDPNRVARFVRETKADAWIIYGGSRDVLEWFASQPVPAFALFGHRIGVKIPAVSPDKPPAVAAATRHLIEFGHRRIVLLCRKIRRLPRPGLSETVFLETLRAHDCPVGDYNLPDWEETNEGFQQCLRALFRVTPPTALIVDEVPYFVAAMQFLLSRGIRVPRDVSLVSTDDDPAFAHCHPSIACITWDFRPAVRRILQWADHVARGKPDLRQTLTPAQFVPGGTVAAVPG
jgi:DNA-binding LacI/PurR family transcriptional regulator